jgi:hypothetical protein
MNEVPIEIKAFLGEGYIIVPTNFKACHDVLTTYYNREVHEDIALKVIKLIQTKAQNDSIDLMLSKKGMVARYIPKNIENKNNWMITLECDANNKRYSAIESDIITIKHSMIINDHKQFLDNKK